MSSQTLLQSRLDDENLPNTSVRGAEVIVGQRHDRIGRDGKRKEEDPGDISAAQKMLSATSGSILTSLLGMLRTQEIVMASSVSLTVAYQLHLWMSSAFDCNRKLQY